MKRKILVVIFATVISIFALLICTSTVNFEKYEGTMLYEFINFDKNSEAITSVQRSFRKLSLTIGRVSDNIFENLGGYEMIRSCKDQPLLFGALFIFFGVSTCSVAFVVHLIRSDVRLS